MAKLFQTLESPKSLFEDFVQLDKLEVTSPHL